MTGDFRLQLAVTVPEDAATAIAERAAEIVLSRLSTQPVPSASPYLTIREAAAYLRCDRQRVDDLLSQRRLSRIKEGGRTLVLLSEVEQHLEHRGRRV